MVDKTQDEIASRSSDAEDSENSFELPEALATGREKRETAGNRLRDMLNAEIESEAIFAEDDEDEDFNSDQENEDDLDSELDNSSEDERGAAAEGEDAGEKVLRLQEKIAARAARRKAHGQTANSAVVKRAASRQIVKGQNTARPKKKLKIRHESAGSAIRQSARAHAIGIAAEVEKRLVEEAARKSKTTKSKKTDYPVLSQAERLEEAKITEERNRASLNKIVQYEEEKRANRKLQNSRRRAMGPLLRFLSTAKGTNQYLALEAVTISSDDSKTVAHTDTSVSLSHPLEQIPTLEASSTRPRSPARPHTVDFEKTTRSYIIFENMPNAGESSATVENLILKTLGPLAGSKSRYPDRPICSISGLPAKYLDPVTQLRYGSLRAYQVLQKVTAGEFPWNPELKMYVPTEDRKET